MTLRLKAFLLTGIPLLVLGAIALALVLQGKPADGRATATVGVIVAATSGASVIYQLERWSLRRQTGVHFIIMLVTVLPALLLSGWFPLENAWGYLAVVGVFLATGLLLWVVFFLVFTRIVPRMNARAHDPHEQHRAPENEAARHLPPR